MLPIGPRASMSRAVLAALLAGIGGIADGPASKPPAAKRRRAWRLRPGGGARECARRRLQIERGQLNWENGLRGGRVELRRKPAVAGVDCAERAAELAAVMQHAHAFVQSTSSVNTAGRPA